MTEPTPKELLATIRSTVNAWAAIYRASSGHPIDPVYLATLANDIAWELGITEAIERERTGA